MERWKNVCKRMLGSQYIIEWMDEEVRRGMKDCSRLEEQKKVFDRSKGPGWGVA